MTTSPSILIVHAHYTISISQGNIGYFHSNDLNEYA